MYDEILDRWKKANPIDCHQLGIHEFDGQLPDYSEEGVSSRINEIKQDLIYLDELDVGTRKMKKFEHKLVVLKLEEELFELKERREFKDSPLPYIMPLVLIETSFTVRNFASIDERLQIIIDFERNIPAFIDSAYENFNEKISAAKINMGLSFLSGTISYLEDGLISFATKSDDEDLIFQWSEANIDALEVLRDFHEKLQEKYLPNAHHDFALGKDRFLQLLEKSEGVSLSYEELLEAGEKDLQRNYQTLLDVVDDQNNIREFLQEQALERPEPGELVDATRETLDRTREYLEKTGIVDLPSDKHCEVIETPEFAREFAFAAMNTPGPFEVEEASEAYYWITPPNLQWSDERINSFMEFFSYGFLEIVTIHEVYPGHYVQLLYNQQTESDITKLLARSTTTIEGWAHYAEEMVYENNYAEVTGFDKEQLHLGQLKGALVRNCRYIAALKMHCEDWTPEDAKELFMNKAFLPEDNAKIEANRGTINPMYLNYTLGKLLILKLREDYRKEKAEEFDLAEFHNTLLSYGSPPIAVLREVMLDEQDSPII